jgi:hypothetical protein
MNNDVSPEEHDGYECPEGARSWKSGFLKKNPASIQIDARTGCNC